MGRENLVQFKKMHTLCIHCGQLILRQISKIGATRCQILWVKCTKFDFRWGSAPDPAGGAYSAPPDQLAVFMGPTSKGKGGKEGGRGGEGERKGKRWHRLYIHCMFYKYATGLPPAGRLVPGATDVCLYFLGPWFRSSVHVWKDHTKWSDLVQLKIKMCCTESAVACRHDANISTGSPSAGSSRYISFGLV